jgi:DNA-binding transcriptional ArsR family regulator
MIEERDEQHLARTVVALKALAEPNRLRAVAAIAERPRTGTELAEVLGLGAPTVSHHMARLEAAGIVHVTPEGRRRRYTLNLRGMQQLAASASSGENRRADDAADDTSAFFAGERLLSIPTRRKKRVAVLQRLMLGFTAGRDYSEIDVNAILSRSHDDVATLRRELIGYGFMVRTGNTYRVASELPSRGANISQEVPPDERAWLAALIEAASRSFGRS